MGYDWRKPNSKSIPNINEFQAMLIESLHALNRFDDAGSYHSHLAGWKDYFTEMEEILQPDGSL
jgi:hypothetical protein